MDSPLSISSSLIFSGGSSRRSVLAVSLTNAQVILEVRSQENGVVFRNIYAVEH